MMFSSFLGYLNLLFQLYALLGPDLQDGMNDKLEIMLK
jgi:hypothetical protein